MGGEQTNQACNTSLGALSSSYRELDPSPPVTADRRQRQGRQTGPGRGNKTGGDTTRFSSSQRNTRAYILARLDRDGHASRTIVRLVEKP
jgi:hypothetical protein